MCLRRVIGYIGVAVIAAAISISGGVPCRAQQITYDNEDCDSLYEADEPAVPVTLAEESVTLPTIPYRTPEAAAFVKYGEYAVGGYTGCPDIRLPLYEIKDRDLTIPLVLSYNKHHHDHDDFRMQQTTITMILLLPVLAGF